MYEIGDRDEAIAEMEDVSISLKGYPGLSLTLTLFFQLIVIQTKFISPQWLNLKTKDITSDREFCPSFNPDIGKGILVTQFITALNLFMVLNA